MGVAGRIVRAWRALPSERRLAAYACGGLFAALFLPWYQETIVSVGRTASATVTGWQAFSFVEAAVLLVAAGVLTLLFQRAEGRAFHVPGGDGGAISAAGVWTAALVVWRIFDKQGVRVRGPGEAFSGVEWGIFVTLGVAVLLAYAGSRIRAAHTAEPPLPGEHELVDRESSGQGKPQRSSEPSEHSQRPVAAPVANRPPGWLSAPPKDRRHDGDEQLTIPLEDQG